MKKPPKKITDDEHGKRKEDRTKKGKMKIGLLRRKVKRNSPGRGRLVSELIREMRC